ncbi:hypothetical protein P3X83_10515 [Spongiactinospora sp. TRM90649]|nr:hypothetical protein [Spongiactinospora sp. TRM90649]
MGAFDLVELSAHLVGDGRSPEATVHEPQVIGLGGEDHDHGRVDGGSGFEAGGQLGALLLVGVGVIISG